MILELHFLFFSIIFLRPERDTQETFRKGIVESRLIYEGHTKDVRQERAMRFMIQGNDSGTEIK